MTARPTTAVVFLGPTLPAEAAHAAWGGGDLDVLPPAAQGDVLRALARRPRVIGLVDGRFDGVPAVLHKELMHAIEQGVHVLGAASMGALRAAELHAFGMQGVGTVFEAFRDGVLEDDDEVALLHADAAHGHAPLSEPLVDIRATLAAARSAGVIEAADESRLVAHARRLWYGDRQWPALLSALAEEATARAAALAEWLPAGRVGVKRDDALALLGRMRALVGDDAEPARPGFRLEASQPWHDFLTRHGRGTVVDDVDRHALLDELRLDPHAWPMLLEAALLRVLARREARRQRLEPAVDDVAAELSTLRERHALGRRDQLDRFLRTAGLDDVQFESAIAEQAVVPSLAALLAPAIEDAVLLEAGLRGLLPAARARAADKAAVLAEEARAGDAAPPAGLLGPWHFRRRGVAVPTDFARHARSLVLPGQAELLQLLAREYLYCAACGSASAATGGDDDATGIT